MAEKHLVRGVLAGVAGGLVASWVMNEFMAGPGAKLTEAVNTPEENAAAARQDPEAQQDATMVAADTIAEVATGGRHLTWEQQKEGGPIVHYAFGAIMGGVYGGFAEMSPVFTAALGTAFGSVLFVGADLVGVPAFHLGKKATEVPAHSLVPHYAAHLVYGATTEIVRRVARVIL